MENQTKAFYNQMAERYHNIFKDWDETIHNQGNVLHSFIVKHFNDDALPKTLLDCTCGIGTQAIALAQKGFSVTGTDLSDQAIKRAKRESHKRDCSIEFKVADLRTLQMDVNGTFDVVLSADNSIPHLVTDSELQEAAANLYATCKENGLLVITIRDYDKLKESKPSSTQPRVYDNGKRITFQVWDWAEDERTYTLHHFILIEQDGEWHTKKESVTYRALRQKELRAVLQKAGFQDIKWFAPKETGFYQPIVRARKSR